MKHYLIVCVVFVHCFTRNNAQYHETYNTLYDLGMDAYKHSEWDSCVSYFNEALKDYNFHKDTVIECRLQCKQSGKSEVNRSLEDVLHTMLIDSRCLRKCKKQKFGLRPEEEVSSPYEKKFQDRQPYNYLQYCHFKNGDKHQAASTAYTFYITHQDDDPILETLNYYKELDGIEEKDFVDLERKEYQKAYIEGLIAYNEGEWEGATEHFETSLQEYYREEEKCRAYCEKGFVHTKFPDFVNAVADHYVMVVVCQQKCLQTLSTFGMDEIENFVSEQYNYLQFSYYKANNLKKAFESITNYLLFRPTDSEMLNNKDFYINTLGHTEEEFKPSQAAVEYVELWKKLDTSISYIRDQYILPNDLVAEEEDMEMEVEEEEELSTEEPTEDIEVPGKDEHYMARFESLGVKLVAESDALGGEGRFVADNVIRSDQCQCLADPAMEKEPDALGIKYIGLHELSMLLYEDSDYEIPLRLLLRAVNVMSIYTQSYFNQSGLFVKDVKIVCLPAKDNKLPEDCILQEDGTCINELSKGIYRSVAYLTSVGDGTGQLYFMDEDEKIQAHVTPKCGRLLGFRGDNQHGVNFSWKIERCAVIVDISEKEEDLNADVYIAKQLVKELQEGRKLTEDAVDNSDILKQFYNQGITISQTGKDLHGRERFVADGLSTEGECEELVKLAKKEGVSGDGYRGDISPHTQREVFSGLDIGTVEQRGVIKGDGYDEDQSEGGRGSRFVSPYTRNEHFEGLNVSRSLEMVDLKVLSARSLQLLLDISEHGRLLTEKYFNLTRPLFFDFTHLVCRTAINELEGSEEQEESKEQLSHPVHADNCVIQPNGSCIADSTTFIQRHYSAVLYLNEDFKGGQFFFAHKNQTEHVSVQPKCGRLVAFNAGDFHGVRAVRHGQRCAIAMWYTHDPNYYEVSRINARRKLDKAAKIGKKEVDGQTFSDNIGENILPPEVLKTDLENGHDEL